MNGKQRVSICVFLACVTLILGILIRTGYYELKSVTVPESTTAAVDDKSAAGEAGEDPEAASTTNAPETTTEAPATTAAPTTAAPTTAPPTTAAPQTTAKTTAATTRQTTKQTTRQTTTATTAASSAQFLSIESSMLSSVNTQRVNAGLSMLTSSSQLNYCARIRAQELLKIMDHTRPNGTAPFTVLAENGVGYSAAGENIAAGYPGVDSVMNGWMNSTGHRENILSAKFTQMGSACAYFQGSPYGYYWVQLFIG